MVNPAVLILYPAHIATRATGIGASRIPAFDDPGSHTPVVIAVQSDRSSFSQTSKYDREKVEPWEDESGLCDPSSDTT